MADAYLDDDDVERWCLRCCRSFSPTQPERKGESIDGIGHVITIATATIAGTAALISYLQETGTTRLDFVYFVYAPAFAVPLGALILMHQMQRRHGNVKKPYFDGMTMVATRWAMTVSGIILACVVGFGSFGMIPGQEPQAAKRLADMDARSYPWTNPRFESGIVASVNIDPSAFPDGYPDYLTVKASLLPQLRPTWNITKVLLLQTPTGKPELELQEFPNDRNSVTPDDVVVPFDVERMKPDATYRVDFYLNSEPKKVDDSVITDGIDAIKDGKGLRAEVPAVP